MAKIYKTLTGVMLIFGIAAQGLAEEIDPRVERIRRDLGYYRQNENQNGGLAAEIRALREEFRQATERQDNRIRQIEEELKQLKPMAKPSPQTPPQTISAEPPRTEVKPLLPALNKGGGISVCHQGCDFQDLQQAVDAAPPGGLISVAAEINGTCAVINKPLRLSGLQGKDGSRAHLAGGVCLGKASLVTAAPNITIEGFEISGIQVGDGNGACIRLDPGSRDITIKNLYCHDSQDGILGGFSGRLTLEDSTFESNGFGNGQAHGLYLTDGNEAVIRRSKILSTKDAGHSLKSGVQKLIVEDSVIAALNGHNSRALDAFAGGDISLRRNVIQQGPQSDNSDVIGLALEPNRLLPGGHSVLLEDNWVIFDDDTRGQKVLFRGQKLGSVVVRNNMMVGLNRIGIDGVREEGNRWAENRSQAGLPAYDGSLATLPGPGKKPANLDHSKIPSLPGYSWRSIFK